MSISIIIEDSFTTNAMVRPAQFVSSRSNDVQQRLTVSTLARELRATEALIISSMPRGGLQIVQPQRAKEGLVRAYGRALHAQDRASWTAIAEQRAMGTSADEAYLSSIQEFGYAYAASAPIADPVFPGYAGVVQVLRTADQGPFSAADFKQLGELASEVELPASAGRTPRAAHRADEIDASWCKRPADRQWAFGSSAQPLLFESSFRELDPQLQEQLVDQAHARIGRMEGGEPLSERVSLPDSEGDLWTFNLVAFPQYGALASGPVVFACLQPDFPEWTHIRPADFQADPELSRLVPALRFMQQEFRRGPTLSEIAQTVHLSPFHFHRRFSELLGLTPKHFLLECQIHEAKHELLAGKKSLAKIAADGGFAHQSHFTSRFKQTTGLTPTRWRRLARTRARADTTAE
jgi:AraC-like DNA-binding protein